MRIISGLYKNRRIHFKKLQSRPTTDFAKESLFNLLNNHYNLEHVHVLDLFAGTGNISYEFISRGSNSVTAIDNNNKCVDFMEKIKSNLKMRNLKIELANAKNYIKKVQSNYDIIFADPPYNHKNYEDLFQTSKEHLNPQGILCFEMRKKNIVLENVKIKVIGKTQVVYWRSE